LNALLESTVVISILLPASSAAFFNNLSYGIMVNGNVANNPIREPSATAISIIGRSICSIGISIIGRANSTALLKVEQASKIRSTPAS
jgi:hypothetical protein